MRTPIKLEQILDDVLENRGDYKKIDDRTYILYFSGWGYSVDEWIEGKDGRGFWEEREMIYLGFPEYLGCDTYEEWIDYMKSWDEPIRTHDYKYTTRTYTLELPENHDDEKSFYYPENWIGECTHGDDVPGMGFDYYNLETDPETDETYEKYFE